METKTETKIEAILRLREKHEAIRVGFTGPEQVPVLRQVFEEAKSLGVDERFILVDPEVFEIIKRQIK